jgi:hypothetical protein
VIVYVTKYALTKGIIEGDVDQTKTSESCRLMGNDAWVVALVETRAGSDWFMRGRSCFDDYSAAVARAEEMRTAKIASLKKQIAKLEKLRFEEVA